MQPEVAAGETTSFPSTISALTDDAPHVQGAWSCLVPLACADLSASTATATAMTKQALTRWRRPQNLTSRGCRAASPSTWAAWLIFDPGESYVDASLTDLLNAVFGTPAVAWASVREWT